MDFYIITGASRGLGKAVAKTALKDGDQVVTISGSKSANQNGIQAIQQDLRELDKLPDLIRSILESNDYNRFSSLLLINNAGTIEPIDLAQNLNPDDVAKNIKINLIAPMILANAFLRETSAFRGWRTIVNVSSGVAEKPKVSWSAYSAAKAGLRNYSQTLALEFVDSERTRILSFNPGIMDTEMQAVIRSQPQEKFAEVERFKGFKNEGKLKAPEQVAKALIDEIKKRGAFSKTELNIQDLL
jgi:benzil reductase ((S)-benzoin forming)